MNLISQIFLIILIACFTGTVSLGFWRVFQPLLLKRDPRLVYATLRFVCMMYIVPFGYLIVRLTWHGYLRTESIWKPNFEMAGDMDLVFGIAGIIWLVFLIKNVADRDFALKNKNPCSACEFQAKQGISIWGIKLLFFSV